MESDPTISNSGPQRQNVFGPVILSDNAQLHQGDVYTGDSELKVDFQRFRDSLFFPELNSREESIKYAREGTFEWLFERQRVPRPIAEPPVDHFTIPGQYNALGVHEGSQSHDPGSQALHAENRPGHSAAQSSAEEEDEEEEEEEDAFTVGDDKVNSARRFRWWLQNRGQERAFWIRGKAGSGKSTLMSFICGHRCSTRLLQQWSPLKRQLIVLKHFFWELGVAMQRNAQGFLRSLLWQFFDHHEEGFEFWQKKVKPLKFHPWTMKNLMDVFREMLADSIAFCLFVDGLDECAEADDVLQILDTITASPNVKVCISSRPETKFEHVLKTKPSLRLDQLTYDDMREYATGELENAYRRTSQPFNSLDVTSLVERLLEKAQGVFIWLCVTVKSLIQGIESFDEWSLLTQIEEMPEDIGQLYLHMIRRGKNNLKKYEMYAALIFKLLLHHEKHNAEESFGLTKLAWALDAASRSKFITSDLAPSTVEAIYKAMNIEAMRVWVPARSASFVEIQKPLSDPIPFLSAFDEFRGQDDSFAVQALSMADSVSFIHKSVGEFLSDTAAGQELLQSCSHNEDDLRQALREADVILFISEVIMKWDLSRPRLESYLERVGGPDENYDHWKQLEQLLNRTARFGHNDSWFRDTLWRGRRIDMPPLCADGILYWTIWQGRRAYLQEVLKDIDRPLSARSLTVMLCILIAASAKRHCGGILNRRSEIEISNVLSMASLLLQAGADPNAPVCVTEHNDYHGVGRKTSVLHYCLYTMGFRCVDDESAHLVQDIVLLLLQHGAQRDVRPFLPLQELSWKHDLLQPRSEWLIIAPWNWLNNDDHIQTCQLSGTCKARQLLETLRARDEEHVAPLVLTCWSPESVRRLWFAVLDNQGARNFSSLSESVAQGSAFLTQLRAENSIYRMTPSVICVPTQSRHSTTRQSPKRDWKDSGPSATNFTHSPQTDASQPIFPALQSRDRLVHSREKQLPFNKSPSPTMPGFGQDTQMMESTTSPTSLFRNLTRLTQPMNPPKTDHKAVTAAASHELYATTTPSIDDFIRESCIELACFKDVLEFLKWPVQEIRSIKDDPELQYLFEEEDMGF